MNNKDNYRDNPLLKRAGVSLEYTEEQVREYIKCSEDPIYFIKTYMKIVNVDEGLINFRMYDFQEKMVLQFVKERFNILKCPRQVGKSTTSIAYLLWLTLFHDQQNVAILANKGSLARDILGKYQLAYENLPWFLQQGIVTWNKGTVELENGSALMAASTSSSAVRGGSFSLVFLDEFGFVPSNIAEEFFNSVYPVISSGKKSKIIIVSTPNGMNMFYKMWMDAEKGKNGYTPFSVNWWDVPGRDEKWKQETINNTSQRQWNQEFECQFLGSSNTLIDGFKLQNLAYIDPIENKSLLKIFEKPIKGSKDIKEHVYAITVDVSEGRNLDASAFSVIDITATPYKQVAVYRSTSISPLLFPTEIINAAKYYNNAYVLVEINVNPQVAEILANDMEYENLLKVDSGNKQGQSVVGHGSSSAQLGLRMSVQTKRMGCSNLKTLVESDKLIINDFDTISELTTFVADGVGFKAEGENTDDLCMTLVIFGWLANQKYFKDIVNHDIRKQLQLETMSQVDDETLPVSFFELQDGQDRHGFMMEDGDAWVNADSMEKYDEFMKKYYSDFLS